MEHHQTTSNEKLYKIDLYSIPVFLIELVVLGGLAYCAYMVHFVLKLDPFISGFYCDDTSYKQQYDHTNFTVRFGHILDMLTISCVLMAAPIVIIIFCELVNSLFGSVKFRKIRAMHTCCRLHSVTRRTLRFSAAYLLGLFLVMISCDILATSTGRLRPYFAQECPSAYQSCIGSPTTSVDAKETPTNPPIKSTPLSPGALVAEEKLPEVAGRILQEPRLQSVFERRWVDLNMQKLDVVCQFNGGDPDVEFQFRHLGTSWPSFPATVFTYACLYVACYLCFAGTARPVRIITSSLVVALALIAVIFNVQLVKERYHHWDDVIAGAVLAFAMVTFILYVYLNKFRDYHYYGNQKFRRLSPKHSLDANLANYNTAETTLGHYNMSDVAIGATNSAMQNDETTGSVSNNDLAMRYFQIPRANYRGTNRPMSAVGQVRP